MKISTPARTMPIGLHDVLLFFCFFLLFHSISFSQDTTRPVPVRDTVKRDTTPVKPAAAADSAGNSLKVTGTVQLGGGSADLSGTSVAIKGTQRVIPTDSSGHFIIAASPGTVLVFSHIGYKPVEATVTDTSAISITLQREEGTLEQVTVSYGKQLKRDITGAITKVDAANVEDIPAAEFGQKLQGKVAGIQIQQSSGIPGNNIVFRIRGAASLGSGNQPLIVVDGQPLNSDVAGGTGDINLIAPDQIESYSVLKDANATALYGSRASNGVILITTKTAKIGKSSVSVNAYHGLQTVPQRGRPDMMNAREFATFMNGFYQDKITYEGWVNPTTGTATIPSDYADPSQYGKGTDWYNALIHTAPIDNYTVNFSVGTPKVSSSTTMNYFNQDGVLYNTGTKRFAFRSNNEYRPIDRLKIGLNLAPAYQIDHNTRGGNLQLNGNRQVVSGADISSPLISPYNSKGGYNLSTASYGMYALPNYLQQEKLMDNDQTNFSFLGNAYIDLEIIHGLHARSSINGDILNQDFNAYYGTQYGAFGKVPPRPTSSSQAQNNSSNTYSWTNENLLTYNTQLGNHSLDVLAGYTTQKSYTSLRSITGTGFATDLTPFISAANNTSGSSNSSSWTIASALARINYDFKKRYYLSASIRNDGSSRFGVNKKYGTFPAVSVAWVVSDEKFFPKWGALNFLKFRGSYGKTGNFNIGNYTQVSLLSPANYGNTTLGEGNTVLGNPDLTWETSKQFDVGADITMLHGRINISYDYYNTRNEGMLSQLPLPYTSGYASLQYNEGSFHIWGHDIQVSTENIKGAFTWNTDFNISFNDNKVVSLVNNTPIGGVNTYSDYNRTQVGHRIGELYGYKFLGVYMNQSDYDKYPKYSTSVVGSARMEDVNGDDTIDIKDRTFLGRTNPKFIYGMTNTFTWKNFDLGVVVAGQVGNKIMNTNLQNLHNLDGVFNVTKDMQYRWRSESDPGNGKVPSTRSGSTELYRLVNSTWVFSGDYLAVKNITLGYTFNKKILHYLKEIRLYGSIQNAFMFTKYPGQNPEVNDTKDNQTQAGLDNGSYPIPRVVMIGANVNF
ncbi:MAG TPA: SusC/RagA family TonB-linked outer membrane protein [Puia sp.]|nr:SusC/RagA family TonB-linked outer membrane protein [Puia sp.]